MSTAPVVRVEVELPGDQLADADLEQVSAELRALWAVERVRLKRCGVGKGAELAGVPRATFMRMLGEHGVPVIDYDAAELAAELEALGER